MYAHYNGVGWSTQAHSCPLNTGLPMCMAVKFVVVQGYRSCGPVVRVIATGPEVPDWITGATRFSEK
jgi:hypothetical protein